MSNGNGNEKRFGKRLAAAGAALVIVASAFIAGVQVQIARTPDITIAPCGMRIANTVAGVCVNADGQIVSK